MKHITQKEFKVLGDITVIKLFPYSCTYLCEQGSVALMSIRRKINIQIMQMVDHVLLYQKGKPINNRAVPIYILRSNPLKNYLNPIIFMMSIDIFPPLARFKKYHGTLKKV